MRSRLIQGLSNEKPGFIWHYVHERKCHFKTRKNNAKIRKPLQAGGRTKEQSTKMLKLIRSGNLCISGNAHDGVLDRIFALLCSV